MEMDVENDPNQHLELLQVSVMGKGLAKAKNFKNMFLGMGLDEEGVEEIVVAIMQIMKNQNIYCCAINTPLDKLASYHILLGRSWMHSHICIPSTLHQCVNSYYRGRDVEIPTTRALFDETKLSIEKKEKNDKGKKPVAEGASEEMAI
ncbi:hypothetical protein L6164_008602 [Bauhinia variegata]|uniref:Uncharacterized protein n=1 Tax=Bauhinia variegata TaxID=167791 RepID=A0ACB9PH80_BAUVA|nr:hypothetical protein L6164_008602 [Bauhinia variegata]